MKKIIIIALAIVLLAGCATTQTEVIRVKVPAFEIMVIPELKGRGYWIESMRLMIIEGKLDNDVLGHEMKHMLHHLDPKLFTDPHNMLQ